MLTGGGPVDTMSAMEPITRLIETRPLIALHAAAALLGLLVGAIVLARRKGTVNHKRLGWFWIGLMAATAVTSVFIRDYRLPNVYGYTPIHVFTIVTPLWLVRGVVMIRRGRALDHASVMRKTFIAACVVTGLLALLPNRFIGGLVWRNLLGLMA